MSRVLLDAVDDRWSAVITHESRAETFASFPDGVHPARLHPHISDNGVSITLDGKTVGHLPADLSYFYMPLKRILASGLTMYVECKVEVLDGRKELVIPYISRRDLARWASDQTRRYRHHLSEKRKLGGNHMGRLTMERLPAV